MAYCEAKRLPATLLGMPHSVRQALENAAKHPDYEDLSDLPNVKVDLRYGTENNLLKRDVYGGYTRALLHVRAAAQFRRATELLELRHPELSFIVFDALRPQAAQEAFWALVAGTPSQAYFADPKKGSIHSYGFAIDVGLLDGAGAELDMGTGFDDLTPLAEPRRESEFLSNESLRPDQIANRKILRAVMEEAGFLQLPHEWWHFDAMPAPEVRAQYRRVE
ncbi:MAG: D-alanyl-D-alanine dipeptidase [Proteobacteria bacterium]|nr:MAG: D-alanyl-D-alanine dipeptidase [Pseudomonadota bacterium]